MKRTLATAILSAALCWSLQTQAQMGGGMGPGVGGMGGPGAGGGVGSIDPGGDVPRASKSLPNDPEGNADEYRLNGNCAKAIPIYRRLAARGGGFELARFHLGQCLLDAAKTEPDAQRAASLKQEGADDVTRAANSGLPNAQLGLVSMYLDGNGVPVDPVAAGMWSLIYHTNGTRIALGLPDISPELQARLDHALTATNWAVAQARADTWSPKLPDFDSTN